MCEYAGVLMVLFWIILLDSWQQADRRYVGVEVVEDKGLV